MNFIKTSLLFFSVFISVNSFGQKTSSFGVILGGNISSLRAVKNIAPNSINQVGLKYGPIFGLNGGLLYRKKFISWLFVKRHND